MNPFDVIDQRLISIEQLLSVLTDKIIPQSSTHKPDLIEASEAAKMIHLGIDRFYSIHKQILSSRKPGRKLLFSRKEIEQYLKSKEEQPESNKIKEAECYRINRLVKK